MVYIYVLELEQSKYYVGKTNDPEFRIETHFGSIGSAWTQKYPPIKVVELVGDCDDYDEDKYVRIYMDKYGIDNVRGGSFSRVKINKGTTKVLDKMRVATQDCCFKCKKPGHFMADCPMYAKNQSKPKPKSVVKTPMSTLPQSSTERICNDSVGRGSDNNEPIIKCTTCNYYGHTAENCFATSKWSDTKPKKKRTCKRCNRTGHKTKECYAKTKLDGSEIK